MPAQIVEFRRGTDLNETAVDAALADLRAALIERLGNPIGQDMMIDMMEYFGRQLTLHHGLDRPTSVSYLADWERRWEEY